MNSVKSNTNIKNGTNDLIFLRREYQKKIKPVDCILGMENVGLTTSWYTENPTHRMRKEKFLKEISEQKDFKWRKR